MADEVSGGAASTPRAVAAPASASQRLKLQTSLGQAVMYSRGFASDDSKTAFVRARTLVAGAGDASERFDAYCGLFAGSALRAEDNGAPNTVLRQLPAPEAVATHDLTAKRAAADAAISKIQVLLGEVRTRHDELRQTLDDLKRDRDEWRARVERLTERPWWRRLAG